MKAALFDVYGTLLRGRRVTDRETPLREVIRRFGLSHPPHESVAERLDLEIRRAHELSGAPFPEVDIRDIWRRLFPGLEDADSFALAAENAIHPVEAIDSSIELAESLRADGVALGIVSNAQAYTRVLLQRHLGELWEAFDPGLLAFSYQHRIAKPDLRLFQVVLGELTHRGIRPDEVVMIGDSPTHDIAPAESLGMRTRLVPTAT